MSNFTFPIRRGELKSCWLVVLLAAICAAAFTTPQIQADPTPAAKRDEGVEAWWADLEGETKEASRALLKLSTRPKEAIPFLKAHLKPLKTDEDSVNALLEKLASDEDKVSQAAFEELEYFDPRLAFDLETLMKEVTDPTTRQRLVEILSGRPKGQLEGQTIQLRPVGNDGFNFSSGQGSWWAEHKVERINSNGWGNTRKKWIRAVRAIALLEHYETPDAIALLKELAKGHSEAQPTKAAAEALERLTTRVK